MKKHLIPVLMAGLTLAACQSNPNARYLDLNTGEYVAVVKDSSSGQMVNAQNGQPIEIYVDTQTHDTIWGKDSKVINGRITKSGTHWTVRQEENANAALSDDSKVKSDDGAKVKTEEDGDTKVKDGSYTKKVDKDGDVKIETGNKKIKIDGETGERKVKKDHNIGDKIKKVFH